MEDLNPDELVRLLENQFENLDDFSLRFSLLAHVIYQKVIPLKIMYRYTTLKGEYKKNFKIVLKSVIKI